MSHFYACALGTSYLIKGSNIALYILAKMYEGTILGDICFVPKDHPWRKKTILKAIEFPTLDLYDQTYTRMILYLEGNYILIVKLIKDQQIGPNDLRKWVKESAHLRYIWEEENDTSVNSKKTPMIRTLIVVGNRIKDELTLSYDGLDYDIKARTKYLKSMDREGIFSKIEKKLTSKDELCVTDFTSLTILPLCGPTPGLDTKLLKKCFNLA
ncbi:MAG: hypothetical protein LBE27_03085 [Deltaproteobacteria bacterium]|jgi:hypothetical protein|nr:hypothetical protein [Deltaproteobacteria bacterium]